MKKIGFIILSAMLLGTITFLSAQEKTITGKVTSMEQGIPLARVNISVKGSSSGTITGLNGEYKIKVPSSKSVLVFSLAGYIKEEVKVGSKVVINVKMSSGMLEMEDVEEEITYEPTRETHGKRAPETNKAMYMHDAIRKMPLGSSYPLPEPGYPQYNTEEYDAIHENTFLEATKNPLSTFSIDVDAASYSNMRRFVNNGQKPPKDAVRIEEMVNYFNYDYKQPKGEDPFSINTEISDAPWNDKHKLVHIGLQGKDIPTEDLPASNLVFLIDVSGSMSNQNKLPLLKSAFKLLVQELRPQDKVSMVVYAGAAGLVLPPTHGNEKEKIMEALNKLSAGGSTAGGAGINLAYKVAKENFQKEGNNRVIIATDGDFNVGASSNAAMERLVEQKREEGVFLTVLGFGMGNYKDSKMEVLADKGNGNYAYIDNILEAKKVLVNEFGGTLFTIAKDVKIQVEFNPAKVQAYRLIGYENRKLQNEDFNNDKKDAGELGSGHTVTALYEIIPMGVESEFSKVDELKYQKLQVSPTAYNTKELLTVKFRYKKPEGNKSKLISHVLNDSHTPLNKTSDNFRWSAAVATFGMLLRDSEFKGDATYPGVVEMARGAKGMDKNGYRAEFINLVSSFELVASK